jgi:hypothetical protein
MEIASTPARQALNNPKAAGINNRHPMISNLEDASTAANRLLTINLLAEENLFRYALASRLSARLFYNPAFKGDP